MATADPSKYTVCIAPLDLQVSYLLFVHITWKKDVLICCLWSPFNTEPSVERGSVLRKSQRFSLMGDFIERDVLLSIGSLLAAALD